MIWISLTWAFAMSVAGMILPPLGVIDSSILILIAQILVFVASIMGLRIKIDAQNGKVETS
jgi:purine-cytosine permease-like protein